MAIERGIDGPHLAAAFLCEKVLQESDGVPSFIRVVERFTVAIPPKLPPGVQLPPALQFPPPVLQFHLVVTVKAGGIGGGKYAMKVVLNKPDGTALPPSVFPVFFNGGDDNGVTMIAPIMMPNPEEGLFWFDVYFEETLMTRIPLRVLHQQMPQMAFPQ
jgi:hypothetical protein